MRKAVYRAVGCSRIKSLATVIPIGMEGIERLLLLEHLVKLRQGIFIVNHFLEDI